MALQGLWMESAMTKLCRRVMLGALGLSFACVPWLWCAERWGWNQRPIHLTQTFVAVPVASIDTVSILRAMAWGLPWFMAWTKLRMASR